MTWKKCRCCPNHDPSNSPISPLHATCPVWSHSYLQLRNNFSVTAFLQNQSRQFSDHTAIPEAAHLHPDERHWRQTLLLFHHTNTNRQLKSLCKTQLSSGRVRGSPLPLITASDWHVLASLHSKMDQKQTQDMHLGGLPASMRHERI